MTSGGLPSVPEQRERVDGQPVTGERVSEKKMPRCGSCGCCRGRCAAALQMWLNHITREHGKTRAMAMYRDAARRRKAGPNR